MKNLLLFVFAGFVLVGCGRSGGNYRKTRGGMPYQVFEGKDTQKIRVGDIVKLQYIQKVKDSLMYETNVPEYRKVMEKPYPYDISEVWTDLELGDSVVAVQMIDTFIKRRPEEVPPIFKKGDKLTHYFKIVGVFTSDSAAQADFDLVNKNLLPVEIKKIEQYLADKKINAQKTPSGAFIEILSPGSGEPVDSGNYVSVNYTGKTFKGITFDSNVDPKFGHVGPYSYTAAAGKMIKGFDEAVLMMRKGAKARAYIPSMLAYGAQPPQQSGIRPYEMMIFDLELVDIKDKEPQQPQPTRQDGGQNIDTPQRNN